MIRVKNPNYVDRLPDEYQEVKYLESTGTQYIDTKVIPQENSRTKTKLEFTSSTQTQYAGFFGAQVDDNNTYGYTFSNVVGNAIKFKGSKNYMSGPTFAINVSYEIDCSINTFNINGANYTNTDTWSQTMDESIYIFTRNSAGVAMSSTFTTGRLYYFMQYEGDVLVRNFIPCYRKSDNIPGLYDLVNNVFYTNAGTGTFLVGKDVNKKDVNIKPAYNGKFLKNRYVGNKLIYGGAFSNYEQLVNYTMLYDKGDECTNITGGWTGGKYITNYSSAGTYTKYDTYMYCKSGSSGSLVSAGFYTTNKINMSDYSKAVFNISQLSPSYVAYIAVDTVQVNAAWTQTVGKRFDTGDNKHSAGLHSLDVSTLTSDLYVKFGCWAYASMIAVDLVFLVKPDDWQKLAEKAGITASSIDDILTNSTTLLSNEAAVEFMIKQCTGDFMASAIQSETFLNALSNSPYNTVIQANEHWNKFLAMVA